MDGVLVLVNGLPGAGKTTLGRGLSEVLGAWFLSKDVVKESLAGVIENATEPPELGGIAMDATWALASLSPVDVVIDSWWFKPRDLAFAQAGIQRTGARSIVEVWCEIPADIAKSRYAARQRAPIYRDEQRLAEHWDDWVARAAPLDVGPVLFVDTTHEIDYAAVASRVRALAGTE
ncbi:AAA family ATPase [Nocardia yunnanensis]|nr:ATP-binding protein [Nocardia yunnanensis]